MKPSLLIIGLGNPGKAYDQTRHNAGYQALDVLSAAFGVGEWTERQKFAAVVQEARVITFPVLLVKPTTYMNMSGEAVQKLVDFYKLDPKEQVLVLSDDIDIDLGELRFRKKGGPGTHNGLKSIVEHYGEDFPRIRLGLGQRNGPYDLAAWVLSRPPEEEQKVLDEAYAKLPEMVKDYVLGNLNPKQ
ncbi:MAG: peptidyl-tRNA hydrolase [Candidatus Peribacteria bacterium]|nr:peptidyl-tRNA hydrolase [Candidatus Peribacteria bacterium]